VPVGRRLGEDLAGHDAARAVVDDDGLAELRGEMRRDQARAV